MAKIKKERDVLFDKILLEKGLKLTAGKYDTFVMLMRPGSMPHSLLHLMNDTTVGLNYIRSRYGKDNKVDFFSLTFDTPLEIPIDSIFLRADNPGEEITDVKGVVKKSSRANETEMLLPSEYLIKKFENVRNGNDTMRYMTDGNGSITIGSDNKESMDFVFEQIELSKFRTKLLTSGRKAFPSGYPVFNDCHPYTIKPLDNGGYYCFDDEKYDLLLAAEAAKSASSSVNENVAQALPLQTQTPSQSLQENNVIGKTMSSREIRRLQESSRLPVSNSNETSIQKNEQLVENSQNTGNIKRQEPSTEDKGTLKAFIRNTVQNSSMDVKAEFEISALTEFVKFVYKKEINIIEVPESYSEKEREKMFHDIKVSNKDHKKISILDYGNGSFQLVAKNSEKESIFEAVSRALPKEKNSPPLKHQSYARLATKRAGDLASYSTRDHIPLDDLLNENYDLNTVLNMRTPTLTNGGKNDIKIKEIKEIKEMKAIFSTIKSGDVMSVIKPLGDTYLPGGLSEWPSEPKWQRTVKISNPEEPQTVKISNPEEPQTVKISNPEEPQTAKISNPEVPQTGRISNSEVPQTGRISNSEVALTKQEELRNKILSKIDFKKFHSQIDGEIAVLALYSYLASEGIRLNVLNSVGNNLVNRVNFNSASVSRQLDIGTKWKTEKDIYVVLKNGHYNGFNLPVPVPRDGNCLFHSAAAMLNATAKEHESVMDGVTLNSMTKAYLEDNFNKFITAFFNPHDESEIESEIDEELKTHSEELFSLVKEYKQFITKTTEPAALQPAVSKTLKHSLSKRDIARKSLSSGQSV